MEWTQSMFATPIIMKDCKLIMLLVQTKSCSGEMLENKALLHTITFTTAWCKSNPTTSSPPHATSWLSLSKLPAHVMWYLGVGAVSFSLATDHWQKQITYQPCSWNNAKNTYLALAKTIHALGL